MRGNTGNVPRWAASRIAKGNHADFAFVAFPHLLMSFPSLQQSVSVWYAVDRGRYLHHRMNPEPEWNRWPELERKESSRMTA